MDAEQALSDLTEISSQVEHAVLIDADGGVAASTLAAGDAAERLAAVARRLLDEAQRVRGRSGAELAQLEAATREGSVFVVREGGRMIAATTAVEPTVGLVFYDLKSCLREWGAEGDGAA